jgi:hypothetical protein
VFNKWSEKYPSGRLVIIGPKTRNKKGVFSGVYDTTFK